MTKNRNKEFSIRWVNTAYDHYQYLAVIEAVYYHDYQDYATLFAEVSNSFFYDYKRLVVLARFILILNQAVYCHVYKSECIIHFFYTHRLQSTNHMEDIALNWRFKVGTWGGGGGVTCSTDCLPGAGPAALTFGPMLCSHSTTYYVQIVCSGFRWILMNISKRCF